MKVNLNNTLEELENDNWGSAPENSTRLVTTIHELRKKPLKDFTVEDLRITIGQSFSLEFLIPLAIKELKQNILAEGDFYEGDLLKNVLSADVNFWKNNYDQWLTIKSQFESNYGLFEDKEHRQLLKSFKTFEQIHHVKD
jgi:hypothetical protein